MTSLSLPFVGAVVARRFVPPFFFCGLSDLRSALEAVASGQGVALAQHSFASMDLKLGRLVRLSEQSIPMPEPYHICWSPMLLENDVSRRFLNWILSEARSDQSMPRSPGSQEN